MVITVAIIVVVDSNYEVLRLSRGFLAPYSNSLLFVLVFSACLAVFSILFDPQFDADKCQKGKR
jgi:hypothetical protein